MEAVAEGVPAGLGAPVYAKLDQDLAAAMMSINAAKGVEIGAGFRAARLKGSENADEMAPAGQTGIRFLSNHAGGILGGISTGAPVVVRVAFKPTSSIRVPRRTVTRAGEPAEIVTRGRHDPCVGIRAVPVVEAMLALVLADHLLLDRAQCGRARPPGISPLPGARGGGDVIGVVLVNLGTPDAPTPAAVRRYLREFLSDRRVVELPAALWRPLLFGVIAPLRSRRVARLYQAIWDAEHDDSPLRLITRHQAERLQDRLTAMLGRGRVRVAHAMRYGTPGHPRGPGAGCSPRASSGCCSHRSTPSMRARPPAARSMRWRAG
ncbi:MAG: hypothetical protein KatS3mg119_0798 [Rhodothalassiaceae bacterium]|nr:MAG: hypothetical protein KatS3mg119_0798 [Rhodothalassiaceae bacterium]